MMRLIQNAKNARNKQATTQKTQIKIMTYSKNSAAYASIRYHKKVCSLMTIMMMIV
jgi:hypothetical protein